MPFPKMRSIVGTNRLYMNSGSFLRNGQERRNHNLGGVDGSKKAARGRHGHNLCAFADSPWTPCSLKSDPSPTARAKCSGLLSQSSVCVGGHEK